MPHVVVLVGIRSWSQQTRLFVEPPASSLFAPIVLSKDSPFVRTQTGIEIRGRESPVAMFRGNPLQWQMIVRVVYGESAESFEETRLCFSISGQIVEAAPACL